MRKTLIAMIALMLLAAMATQAQASYPITVRKKVSIGFHRGAMIGGVGVTPGYTFPGFVTPGTGIIHPGYTPGLVAPGAFPGATFGSFTTGVSGHMTIERIMKHSGVSPSSPVRFRTIPGRYLRRR